jgi:hypothetical protein
VRGWGGRGDGPRFGDTIAPYRIPPVGVRLSILLSEFIMSKRSRVRQLFARPVPRPVRQTPHWVRPAVEVLEDRWVPSPAIVVNNPTDTHMAGQTDLREAIAQANAANVSDGDQSIVFDGTVFNAAKTITLTGGQLELSNTSVKETITGPAAGVTVNGGGVSRVFQVDGMVKASISGMTITGGKVVGFGAYGGGVENHGTLALTNCTVSGNTAGAIGGVFNSGTATLTNCTVSGNSAHNGGGVWNAYGGTATLTNCTVSGNSTGGVQNGGTLALTNCTFSGNSNFSGGGVNNVGTATLTSPTQDPPRPTGSMPADRLWAITTTARTASC